MDLRDFAEKGSAVLFRTRAVLFDAVPLLIRLGTDMVMSCQGCVCSKLDMHSPDAHVATVSWTKLTSRLPFTAMPKLYLELRPSLAHSCVTTVLEKPVLLTLVMKSCSTEEAMPGNRKRETHELSSQPPRRGFAGACGATAAKCSLSLPGNHMPENGETREKKSERRKWRRTRR